MNTPITRTQVRNLEMGFTSTGTYMNRRQRRSKEYQKMIAGLYKQEALKMAEQAKFMEPLPEQIEGITLHNFITNDKGELIQNPILTNESTINTTTE